MTLLSVAGLDVCYGDFQALFGVDLAVRAGETLALVGANGAGKTTLLRTIAGAIRPRGGRIVYDGVDLGRLSSYERISKGIAIVPEGRRLFPSLTAEENIKVGMVGAAAWPIERLYETIPLAARVRRRRASLLSGGEQQAVAIARALASGPRLLLLDEISLGLAPVVVDLLYEVLGALEATVVLVEQDLDRALAVADAVVCLLEGRVSLTADRNVDRASVERAYFGGSNA